MGGLFDCLRKKPEEKLDKFENAIFNAKLARDDVNKYIKRMEMKYQKQKELAIENLKLGNREKAKLCLGRSKAYETQVEVGRGQYYMLLEQINQIETTKIESEAIKVLEKGNKVLKKLQNETSLEKWENIKDDLDEMKNQHKEIQDFLQSQGQPSAEYEDNINYELDQLMKLQSEEENINLPEVKKDKKNIIGKSESSKKEILLS